MDEIVENAMRKWPNVPACYGWLALDARGAWRMRDERAQALGLAGERIEHAALQAFIARNYGADEQGRWFFQNGPQRVFVDLALAPWVWRIEKKMCAADQAGPELPTIGQAMQGWVQSQTGWQGEIVAAFLDEHGHFFLQVRYQERLHFGVLHDGDAALLAQTLVDARGVPLSDAQIEAALTHDSTTVLYCAVSPTQRVMLKNRARVDFEHEFGFVLKPQPDSRNAMG